jgi:hypothetical protein
MPQVNILLASAGKTTHVPSAGGWRLRDDHGRSVQRGPGRAVLAVWHLEQGVADLGGPLRTPGCPAGPPARAWPHSHSCPAPRPVRSRPSAYPNAQCWVPGICAGGGVVPVAHTRCGGARTGYAPVRGAPRAATKVYHIVGARSSTALWGSGWASDAPAAAHRNRPEGRQSLKGRVAGHTANAPAPHPPVPRTPVLHSSSVVDELRVALLPCAVCAAEELAV